MVKKIKNIFTYSFIEATYEVIICLFAMISVIIAIFDLNNDLSWTLVMIDSFIYAVFVLDYVVRLFMASSKRKFFRHNIWDLLAIFPFIPAVRLLQSLNIFEAAGFINVAKASRFLRIARLSRLTRLIAALGRLFKKSKSFLNTNGFKYLLYFSFLFIITGGSLFAYFENMTIMDGVWCAFVTITTVGYGDISPATTGGRIIAGLLMLFGIGLIGSLTSTITSYYLRSKEEEVISNDRIDMVEKMYNELSEEEKEVFRKKIEK